MLKAKTKATRRFLYTNKMYIAAFFLCFVSLLGTRLYVNQPITGDEPHYLLMDYSLENDKDLDLKNNYIHKDYSLFTNEFQPPHVSPLNLNDPSSGWYSFHGVGLPILILPLYLIAEKIGPLLLLVLIATFVLALLAIWTYIITKSRTASLLTAGALLSCYFFNGLAGYIYPDLVIAAMTLGAFIILGSTLRHRTNYQFLLGVLLGVMVLLHFRAIAVVLPLAIAFFYLHWKKYGLKIPWAFIVPSGLLAVFFFTTLYGWFGVWRPNEIYASNVGVSINNLLNVPAILFDSLRGSFTYNPILFIIPVGLPIWFKYHRESFRLLLLLSPIIFVTFGYNEWHGGVSPNGRYVMGFLPVLFPAIGLFYMYAKSKVNRAALYSLLGSTFAISLVAVLIKQPYTGYAPRTNIFLEIEQVTSIGFDKVFPTYFFIDNTFMDKYGPYQAVFWMLILVLLFVYGVIVSKKKYGVVKK